MKKNKYKRIRKKVNKDDLVVQKYLEEICDEVNQKMIKLGLVKEVDGKLIPLFGSCHTRWKIEKEILKKRYNIDYQTPSEKNPFIYYD